jgi:predicted ATPase
VYGGIAIYMLASHSFSDSKQNYVRISQARRFITLIDELYNHHCRLFCLAASSIDELFQGTEEGTLFDLER